MSKFLILKKRRDFLRAAREETVVFHNVIVQAARPVMGESPRRARIGFTATKKLGKAYVRNRTKRRLRAVMQEIYNTYARNNIDYVLIGRLGTYRCPFDSLRSEVIRAFKKINQALSVAPEEQKHAKTAIASD